MNGEGQKTRTHVAVALGTVLLSSLQTAVDAARKTEHGPQHSGQRVPPADSSGLAVGTGGGVGSSCHSGRMPIGPQSWCARRPRSVDRDRLKQTHVMMTFPRAERHAWTPGTAEVLSVRTKGCHLNLRELSLSFENIRKPFTIVSSSSSATFITKSEIRKHGVNWIAAHNAG